MQEIESSGRAASPQEHSNDTNTGQTSSNDCFSNNAPEPAMTVPSRNLQVITGRAAREGSRERVCFAQKPRAYRLGDAAGLTHARRASSPGNCAKNASFFHSPIQ
jgi:hypothetical protein